MYERVPAAHPPTSAFGTSRTRQSCHDFANEEMISNDTYLIGMHGSCGARDSVNQSLSAAKHR